MTRAAHIGIRTVAILAIVAAGAVVAQEFEMTRWTVDGGGAMRSTGGDFELSGTIGQHDARAMTGGEFELTGGFWFPLAPSDCNEDGGVNLMDHSAFESCLADAGPDTATPAGCECFDVNRSDTVDLRDFAIAQTTFTGP